MNKRQQAIQQKIENKQSKIKLLKKAHSLIKRYKEKYICFAIEQSGSDGYWCDSPEYLQINSLQDYIETQLKKTVKDVWCPSLEDYQKAKGIYKNSTEIRKDRLTYIRWMIACLEEDIASLNEKLLKGKLK